MLTKDFSLFKRETLETLTARLLEGRRLLVIDISAMWVRTVQAAEAVGIDVDTLNKYLDEHQAIILKQGARVSKTPPSGFVE